MTEGIDGGLPERRSGWFAMVIAVGVILIVLGVWNAIDGLTALVAGDFVVADAERVVALQVAAWGWVLLALGVVEVVAGIALFIGAGGPGWSRCWLPASTDRPAGIPRGLSRRRHTDHGRVRADDLDGRQARRRGARLTDLAEKRVCHGTGCTDTTVMPRV